jgi:hypothetical protein
MFKLSVSLSFVGLAALFVMCIVAGIRLNPSINAWYINQMLFFFGTLTVWALFAAWQIWSSDKAMAGLVLLCLLSLVIAGNWLKAGTLHLSRPTHPVMFYLRLAIGLSVIWLWIIWIARTIIQRRSIQAM